MKIRGVDVDFDFLDADCVEKFENEVQKVKEKAEEYEKKDMKLSETIKLECMIIKEFFDNVFGEGTSFSIFGEKNNLQDCITAFEDIVKEKLEQQKEFENAFNRYQPNREQRRVQKRK